MSPDEPTEQTEPGEGGDEDVPEGVFGNLPQTRPGSRSPRRDAGPAARTKVAETSGATRPRSEAPSVGSSRAGSRTQAESGTDPAASKVPDPTGDAAGGLEDVAWAGVAAAAEAATIGVRLATRALEAMRDAVDRR